MSLRPWLANKLGLLDDLGSGIPLNDLRRHARGAGFARAGFRIVDHDVRERSAGAISRIQFFWRDTIDLCPPPQAFGHRHLVNYV